MSTYINGLKEKAKQNKKRVVLPEGEDIRTVEAAAILVRDEVLKEVVVLGSKEKMLRLAKEAGVSLDGVTLIDPKEDSNKDAYIEHLKNRRSHKGVDFDKARDIVESNTLYHGAAMVALGNADGMVAGAANATAVTIRSTLFMIGLKEGMKTLSSFFIMLHPDSSKFENGVFVYADCGVVPNPTASQLADIAMSTADSYKALVGNNPKVALLSFSTKGSGSDPIVDKVIEAKEILDSRQTDFIYDGEMQFDAAVVEKIGKSKAPNSPIQGDANVFIFPDLNAGNICYKATQRLAGCTALGPLLQGAAKPVNDLSRGCSAQDIADIAVITALQS